MGNTVRRPVHGNSPLVHALLRHLEDVGFAGAPRFLGVDSAGRPTSVTAANWNEAYAYDALGNWTPVSLVDTRSH